jgi:hypothetical protein
LGDSILDIQTLNGTIIMSGSGQLTGSMGITGDLNVIGNISSSTLSGVGNVTIYSASVQSLIFSISSSISGTITTLSQSFDSRLDFLEGPFSTSVDLRLDQLEAFSSSLQTNFVTTVELTQTASALQNNINTKLNTSSFNDFQTNNYNQYTSSTNSRLNVIETTFATTGSNTFNGNQTINGTLLVSSSMVYSGSVRGQVRTITINSNTASMDCSLGNFFTLSVPSSSITYITGSNFNPGQTVNMLVTQGGTTGSLRFEPTLFKFSSGSIYTGSRSINSTDIVSFLTFNSTTALAASLRNLV